jgi:hypothetical protein
MVFRRPGYPAFSTTTSAQTRIRQTRQEILVLAVLQATSSGHPASFFVWKDEMALIALLSHS